ncbi:MAG: tol-pal system protein YbgF [Gammaproteobacteria bacterium]
MIVERNKLMKSLAVAAVLMAAAAGGSPVLAASVQDRLDNIERKLDARGLVDMLNRIDQLQRDLRQLRGTLELQANTMEDIKRQQREQYMDIDRRLLQLETGQAGVLPGAMPGDGGGMAPVLMPPAGTPPMVSAPPVSEPPVSAQPAAAPVDPALAQAEYDTALAVLREGRYADAALAFKQFLNNHPGSSLADNANYWLGETYYVTRDFDQAMATFSGLVTNYPQSPKVADSRLKLGFIYFEKADWKKARAELEGVVSAFPASTAARLANDRLARMKKEGH